MAEAFRISGEGRAVVTEGEIIQQEVEKFTKRTGIEVTVSARYMTGSYYTNSPVRWYAASSKGEVGPESSFESVLQRIEKGHK